MKLKDIKLGRLVKWNDPDNGACSGLGNIAIIDRPLTKESIIFLVMLDGGEVESLPHELSLPDENKPLTKEQKSI